MDIQKSGNLILMDSITDTPSSSLLYSSIFPSIPLSLTSTNYFVCLIGNFFYFIHYSFIICSRIHLLLLPLIRCVIDPSPYHHHWLTLCACYAWCVLYTLRRERKKSLFHLLLLFVFVFHTIELYLPNCP